VLPLVLEPELSTGVGSLLSPLLGTTGVLPESFEDEEPGVGVGPGIGPGIGPGMGAGTYTS